MSTRSSITVSCLDGWYRSVYCHFDGYLDGVGKKLLENYNSQQLAEKLVELGDMSTLGTTVEDTVYYSRDKGEDICITKSRHFIRELQDYNYYWNGQKWMVGAITLECALTATQDE